MVEHSFLYMFFFLASSFIFLKLILSSRNRPKTISNRQLPPGNTGLPYIGETLQFSILGRNGTPEKFFMDRMNKYSHQVFKTSLIGEKTAVCCGVSGNKFLFSNENKLVALSWPGTVKKIFPYSGTTVAAINQTSMRFRHILNGVFNPDALQNCVGIIDVVTKEHLKNHWDVRKEVNHVLSLAKQFAFAVSCKLFLNIDDLNNMNDLVDEFEVLVAGIFSIPINFPGTTFNRGIKASNSIRKKLLGIILQRKNDMKVMDYLSCLLTATDDNGKLMTELEITDHLLASLIGSRDSTASVITCIIKYLAEYPHIYDEVLKAKKYSRSKTSRELLNWKDLQKMKFAWDVVREVMRLMPPMQGNFRVALSDFSYSNFFIPKGWKLYWSPNTTHRNPEYFSEPDKFDPYRFERTRPIPYAYVPFGGGSRICPGQNIARLVILTFVYNVVGKFRWEKIIPNEKIVVSPLPMPAKGLPVRLYPN